MFYHARYITIMPVDTSMKNVFVDLTLEQSTYIWQCKKHVKGWGHYSWNICALLMTTEKLSVSFNSKAKSVEILGFLVMNKSFFLLTENNFILNKEKILGSKFHYTTLEDSFVRSISVSTFCWVSHAVKLSVHYLARIGMLYSLVN